MRFRVAIATTTAVALAALTACSVAYPHQSDAPGAASEPVEVELIAGPKTVAVLGDSLTVQSTWAIDEQARASGLAADIDATNGYRTRDKQDAAVAVAATHPAAAVIALGTNDSACVLANTLIAQLCATDPTFELEDMYADLDRMAATLRQPGTCVVGVTVYFGEEVGTHLEAMVAAGTLDGIVDWRSVVSTDDALRSDGIGHLSPAGQEAYARRMITETARICGL